MAKRKIPCTAFECERTAVRFFRISGWSAIPSFCAARCNLHLNVSMNPMSEEISREEFEVWEVMEK